MARKVLQTIIRELYRAKRCRQLNWYGTSVSAQGGTSYHMKNQDQFPGADNTGIPLVGNVTIAMVAMEVEGDVDTVTNEMTNTKCSLNDDAERQVFKDYQDEMEYTLQTAQTYLGGNVSHRKKASEHYTGS